jgi:hypothetical protein
MDLFQKVVKTFEVSEGATHYIFSDQEPPPQDKGVRDSQHNNNRRNEYSHIFHHINNRLVLGDIYRNLFMGIFFIPIKINLARSHMYIIPVYTFAYSLRSFFVHNRICFTSTSTSAFVCR